MEIALLSLIAVLLAVLLGFVIRGSFIIGERLGRLEEGQERINKELEEVRNRIRVVEDRIKTMEGGQEKISKELEEIRNRIKAIEEATKKPI